ncbi:MAG: redoxin domain-containing protein [Planctomycetaceae bacterium]
MTLFPPAREGRWAVRLGIAMTACVCGVSVAHTADPPTPELALSFRPAQKNIEIDTPDKADFEKCEVKVEKSGKISGWLVLGPQGQMLRRFLDTNADNVVDQWRYFHNGLEVYRDIDTNANNKANESRWLNTAGTRWGVDANEDGKIDSWKVLSAEEASEVAVEAMLRGDVKLLQSVLIDDDDLKALGVDEELSAKLTASVADPVEQLAVAAKDSKILGPGTTWLRFDSSNPGVIPADDGKAKEDLYVYENAMAIVDVGGEAGLVQIGEMIRVGETWKLTQVPKPIEGDSVQITQGGLLMQPPAIVPGSVPGGISPKMRELLEALQKLDGAAPDPADGVEAFAKYNAERARILAGLAEASETAEDKEMWTRQFADSVSAAVTTGVYPEGLKALENVERQLAQAKTDPSLLSYVRYRRLFAEYNLRHRDADAEERVEVQKWWYVQLEDFVKQFPKAPDAAEALLQLAISKEFDRDLETAADWYETLVKNHPESGPGLHAAGALHRLGLKGKPFEFTASGLKGETISTESFRGKVLLVLFWSTACRPCEEELPLVRALYEEYKENGFEILGVNLDLNTEDVPSYIAKHQMTWPQVHEPGGQESKPARQFGIISQPTMFLVGRDGKVLSRGVSIPDLKASLPDLLKREAGAAGPKEPLR